MSQFDATLKALSENPETDQSTLAGLQGLFNSFKKDIEEEMSVKHAADTKAAIEKERDRQAHNLIMLTLDDYIGDDAKLRRKEEWLYSQVVEEFNKNPDYEAARKKYANGSIDVATLKKISIKIIDEETGKSQVTAKGVKGVTQQDGASAQANSAAAASEASDINPKSLKGNELEYYQARINTAQKLGHRPDSKEAHEIAASAVRSMRAAKARNK